jgi:hypothetical protein
MEQFMYDEEEAGPSGRLGSGVPDRPRDFLLPERPPQQAPSITLPPFWINNAAGWFAMAESRFRVRRVYDEWDRYDNLVSALSQDSIRLVLDIVTNPPEEEPYTHLKARLLHSHELTNYQRIEQLMALDSLGDRKPTQLLAQMLELCPAGEETSSFFAFHFLQRLPQELRIMLGDDDHTDIQQLAVKADRLWAIHGHRMHGSVAAVAAPADPNINAVRGNRGGKGGRGRGRGQQMPPPKPAAASSSVPPASLARASSGLCYYHWSFGEKATKCEGTCSWQGN